MNMIAGITRNQHVTTTVYSDGSESMVVHASEAAAVEYEQSIIALAETDVTSGPATAEEV